MLRPASIVSTSYALIKAQKLSYVLNSHTVLLLKSVKLRVLNLCDAIRKVWKKSENHADTRRLFSPSAMLLCSLAIPHVEPGSRSRVNASC